MRNRISSYVGMTLLAMCFLTAKAEAQEADEWRVNLILPLWAAGLDGEVAALGRSVEIDQSFGDILSNLEMGFAGAVRAHKGPWAISGELTYIGLGANIERPKTEVDVDQWLIQGDVAYKVKENFEVLGGLRYVSIQNKIALLAPVALTVEADKDWVDPIIGIRFTPQLSKNWSLWSRLDIGGFDVGSNLTWQMNAAAVWQVSKRTSVSFGYRIIDMDYDDEDGFVYDATSQGPLLGIVLNL